MIQLAVDCLRFGRLAVSGAAGSQEKHYCVPAPAFEIVTIDSAGAARAEARIEVDRGEVPTMAVTRMQPAERTLGAAATVSGTVVLARWRDEAPTHFKLTAAGGEDRVEIVLSGDCRHRMFWWRAEFKLVNDCLTVHGPFLSDDHY
ncbi:MAG: hypothetical protein U0Q18_27390 [Bryobacteraceae bacterium]